MTLPVSTTFDLFDWNSRAAYADDGSVEILSVTDGFLAHCVTPYRSVVAYRGGVVLTAVAGVSGRQVAEARIDGVNVPGTFTVEFDIEFIRRDFEDYALPKRLSATSRLYVGVASRGAFTVGLLFSYAGIYLANGPDDARPTLLADSASLLLDDTGAPRQLTIRATVLEDTGRTTIYIAPTDEAYLQADGSGWPHLPNLDAKYTLYAGKTPDTQSDSILLHASVGREDGEGDLAFKIKSWRLASSRVLPESKPTTSIVAPFAQLVGEVTNITAGNTVSESSAELVYEWNLEQQPAGAKPYATGGSAAYVLVGGAGELRVKFREPTTRANDWTFVLLKGAAGDPLALSVNAASKRVSARLACDADGTVLTRVVDLYRAITSSDWTGFDVDVTSLLVAELIDPLADNDAALTTGSFRFAHGALSTLRAFSFIPDMPGVYLFSLRVGATISANGVSTVRYSDKAFATLHGQLSDQLMAHTPGADFIFQYLPDFWNLIPDRNILSHYWSSVVQAVGAELAALWQNDLSKTISSINRLYQRRWLSYSPRIDVADSAAAVLVTPSQLCSAELQASTRPTTGTSCSSGTSTASQTPAVVGPAVLYAEALPPAVVTVVEAERVEGLWTVVLADNRFPYFSLLAERTAARFVESSVIEDTTYSSKALQVGDFVRVYSPETGVPSLAEVVQTNVDNDVYRFRISGYTRSVDGQPCRWDHLRGDGVVRLEQKPYFWLKEQSVTDWGLRLGDYAICDIVHPLTNAEATVNIPIVAAAGNHIFVDWAPLLSAMNSAASVITGVADRIYTEDSVAGFEPKLRAVVTVDRLPITQDLTSIPTLGATPGAPILVGNFNYVVEHERVHFLPLVEGAADFTNPSDGRFLSSVRFAPGLDAEADLPAFTARGASVVVIPEGLDAGTYHVDRLSGARLTLPVALRTGKHRFVIPAYSYAHPMPETLWAEVSYFDNWRTIQRNFGVLVGLPRDLLYPRDGVPPPGTKPIDYLQAVRACWMGFVFGPQIANIQLALQSFFDLPFTPTSGHVVDVVEPVERGDIGRILFLGADGEVSTFTYPFGASLSVNPSTGRVIRGTDPATPEAERGDDWEDGELPAFFPLVVCVSVDDEISAPDLLDELGVSPAARQHTFVARIPLSIVRSTELFPLLRSFITEVKPAYTNCIVIGNLGFHDDVGTTDYVTREARLHLSDVGYGSRAHAVLTDSWPYENSDADDAAMTQVWPTGETLGRPDSADGTWDASDVTEKFESGFLSAAFDDYSGDGGRNQQKNQHHPVNQLDGDLNVTACRLWVPVVKDQQAEVEFTCGEEITVLVDGLPVDGHIWNESPPVLLHVGAGEHPKIPFGVYSPQNVHPNTYLLLGFDNPNYAEKHNYGTERRLDALAELEGVVQLVGSQSGATASISLVPDRASEEHSAFFLLEKIFQEDLIAEHAPECRPLLLVTTYVPFGGITQNALAVEGSLFDFATCPRLHQQVQTRPYRVLTVNNEQMVPSFGPGLCLADASLGLTYVHWDYADIGDVADTPTDIADFTFAASATQIENIHAGFAILARKEFHYTHGFVSRSIPRPVLVLLSFDTGSGLLRLEGSAFIAPDYTNTGVLTADPTSYDGVLCGSWVFLRVSGTATEYAAGAVEFEEGTAAEGERTVLGIDGNVQTSTGHVLIATPPASLPAGFYDVIVRHYRPYQMSDGGPRYVHVEESLLLEAFQISGISDASSGAGVATAGVSSAGE